MRLVTAEQMRALDGRTIELGTPSIELMERAGKGVADGIHRRFAAACRRGVLVVAGAGNNGGDGFVIARLLARRGYRVRVALLAPRSRLTPDAAANLERWTRRRGRILDLAGREPEGVAQEVADAVASSGVVVDAVFGIGLSRAVEGASAAALEAVNARIVRRGRPPRVVAVDVPSGLDADRGEPLGVAVRADVTYMLGAAKLGLFLPVARPWTGDLEVVDIGLAPQAVTEQEPLAEASTARRMRALLPDRPAASHKGTHGHLLLVAGAPGTSGAAALAARAALRTGAGLVTVACPPEVQALVAGALPEVMTTVFEGFSPDAWSERMAGKKAIVIGPGLGTGPTAVRLVRWLVRHATMPLLIDADALNALAERPGVLRHAHAPVVVTPHPGEMGRLCATNAAAVQADRWTTARRFAERTGTVVALKGSGTLIAGPDGRMAVNATGGPILGTAGTGDVLSGVVGSLLAQGADAFDAARLGVHLHGLAGDRLARRFGEAGLLASELADEIPLAREELRTSA